MGPLGNEDPVILVSNLRLNTQGEVRLLSLSDYDLGSLYVNIVRWVH